MRKTVFFNCLTFLFFSILLFSCQTMKFTEKYFFENEGKAVFLADQKNEQNVNGSFPDKIYIKTLTQTFGNEYEFLLDDGKIYYKKIGTDKKNWELYLGTGLPHSNNNDFVARRVVEIASDADCLYAFSDEGLLYRTYLKKITSYPPFEWVDYFGWPRKNQLRQNCDVKGKVSWAVGSSRKDVEYYTDILGNEHNYGPLGCESVTFLCKEGNSIRYSDPACPADFSHSFRMPSFAEGVKAVNISESASTIFLICSDGSMYTRLVDYNTVGSDPMLYQYSYEPVYSDLKGSDEKSNVNIWMLPNESWKKQSQIENARFVSKYITIIQTGKGNSERELRVAGINDEGKIGFFYKNIDDKNWLFCEAPLVFNEQIENSGLTTVFSFEKSEPEKSKNECQLKTSYVGNLWKNGEKVSDISCEVLDFCFSEGPAFLNISSCSSSESLVIGDNRVQSNRVQTDSMQTCSPQICRSQADSDITNYSRENVQIKFYYSEIWSPFLRVNPGYGTESVRYFGTAFFDKEIDNPILGEIFNSKTKEIHSFLIHAHEDFLSISIKISDDTFEFYLTRDGEIKENPKNDWKTRISKQVDEVLAKSDNPEKEFKNLVKDAKYKKMYTFHLKNGIKLTKFTAKTLLVDKFSPKVKILTLYSDKIVDVNKNFYSDFYELLITE